MSIAMHLKGTDMTGRGCKGALPRWDTTLVFWQMAHVVQYVCTSGYSVSQWKREWMHAYVFCWPRWPSQGTVCAKCKTIWRQQVGTIKRVTSFAWKHSAPFVRTYLSLHGLDTLSRSAFLNSGFKDSSSLWEFWVLRYSLGSSSH